MFTAPRKTQDGRYYVKPNDLIIIQLNGVKLFSKYPDSPTLTIEVGDCAKINEIDAQVLEQAKLNSEAWFQRVVAEKTLEAAYTKSTTDGVLNVSKVKQARVFRDKEETDGSELVEGTVCDVVLEFSGVSFTKTKFSPVWKLVQVRTKSPPKKKYADYLFADPDPEPEPELSDDDI